jgi:hypothetical protein
MFHCVRSRFRRSTGMVGVGVMVLVEVGHGVKVGVGVKVIVGVIVMVTVKCRVHVAVGVTVKVLVAVGVVVSVDVGVAVGVWVDVWAEAKDARAMKTADKMMRFIMISSWAVPIRERPSLEGLSLFPRHSRGQYP